LPPLSLSEDLRQAMSMSTERALYSLAEHSIDDLATGLKTLIKTDPTPEIDIEHIVQILSRLIERELYLNTTFIKNIRDLVEELSLANNPTTQQDKRKAKKIVSSIQDLYMFYRPPEDDAIVRTGDLVELGLKDEDGNPKLIKAVVLTPACDLANPGKTLFLRLAIVENIPEDDANKPPDSEWGFVESGKKFRVSFHQLLVVKNKDLSSSEDNSKFVMSYKHNYVALNRPDDLNLKRIKRLEEPYRSDLLHSFVSHAGRIGQPDFSASTWIPE
jgi:hypothetical protein